MRSRPRQISSSWCCRGGSEKPSKSSLRYCSSNSASIALHTSNSLASPGRWLSFPFDFRFFPPQNQQQFGAVVSHKWTYEDQELKTCLISESVWVWKTSDFVVDLRRWNQNDSAWTTNHKSPAFRSRHKSTCSIIWIIYTVSPFFSEKWFVRILPFANKCTIVKISTVFPKINDC